MFDNYKDILTIDDLYEILPLGKTKIYAMIKDGTIKSVRCGRKIMIPKTYLLEFING